MIVEVILVALIFDGILFCCSGPSLIGKICDIMGW